MMMMMMIESSWSRCVLVYILTEKYYLTFVRLSCFVDVWMFTFSPEWNRDCENVTLTHSTCCHLMWPAVPLSAQFPPLILYCFETLYTYSTAVLANVWIKL